MRKIPRAIVCCLSLLLFYGTCQAAETINVMAPLEVYRFARELEHDGDFNRAATEYRRYISFAEQHPELELPQLEEAMFSLAGCLTQNNEHDKALKAYAAFGKRYPQSTRIAEGLLRLADIYQQAGDIDEAKNRFRAVLHHAPETAFADQARLELAFLAISEGDDAEARQQLTAIRTEELAGRAAHIQQSMNDLAGTDKNPLIAGGLSAILPGAGHYYAGRRRDATFAFLSNALLLAATLESFDENLDVLGGILALCEVGWYTGTIYSAVSLTHRHNNQQRQQLRFSFTPYLRRHDGRPAGGVSLSYQF